jgi:predicted nucleic acid-binding protein
VNLVIDASVAIKWFAPESLSREAERLLDGGDALFAPDLLLAECGNIIWKKVRLGEITRADGDVALRTLRSGPIDFLGTMGLVERALQLAHEIDHPLYDCLYLAAAEAVDATVVTADRRFFERCSASILQSRIAWLADRPVGP